MRKLLGLIFLSPFFSFSQTDTLPTVKQYNPLVSALNLRADYYFKNGSYLYFENGEAYQNAPFASSKISYSDMLGVQFRVAPKWYLGLSEKFSSAIYDQKSFFTEVNALHTGKIGSFNFIQGATFDNTSYVQKKGVGGTSVSLQELGLAAALSKSIKIGNKSLYLMLSYRAFKQIGSKASENQRFIYDTRLRGDIYYFLSENFYMGVYATRDTQYESLLGGSTAYKLNLITPMVGVVVNYIFNFKKADNFLPNLPFH